MAEIASKQLLHLVVGGELSRIGDVEFKDLSKLDIVGIFPNYATAYNARRALPSADTSRPWPRYAKGLVCNVCR